MWILFWRIEVGFPGSWMCCTFRIRQNLSYGFDLDCIVWSISLSVQKFWSFRAEFMLIWSNVTMWRSESTFHVFGSFCCLIRVYFSMHDLISRNEAAVSFRTVWDFESSWEFKLIVAIFSSQLWSWKIWKCDWLSSPSSNRVSLLDGIWCKALKENLFWMTGSNVMSILLEWTIWTIELEPLWLLFVAQALCYKGIVCLISCTFPVYILYDCSVLIPIFYYISSSFSIFYEYLVFLISQ